MCGCHVQRRYRHAVPNVKAHYGIEKNEMKVPEDFIVKDTIYTYRIKNPLSVDNVVFNRPSQIPRSITLNY